MVRRKNPLQIHRMTIGDFEHRHADAFQGRSHAQISGAGKVALGEAGDGNSNEFEFSYNDRTNADIFGAAIRTC